MQIRATQVLKGFDGNSIKSDGKEATFRNAACAALMAVFDDEAANGETKLRRYVLATKIFQTDDVTLTLEEAAEIKLVVGKAFGPIVVGPMYALLNG